MNLRLMVHLSFFLFPASVMGQDPQFSQFYANPIYTNPAFTGAATNARVTVSARSQYIGLNKNYRTGAASFDMNIAELNGGIGLIALTDMAGDGNLTSTIVGGVYAYHLSLNRYISLRAGIEANYHQRVYDFSQFRFGDQIDDRYGFTKPTNERVGQEQIGFMNFGTGMLVYSNQLYAGLAIHNLTEPNQSFYNPNASNEAFKLPRRYTLHAGGNIFLSKQRNEALRTALSPAILYMQQRNFNQLNIGLYYKKQSLTAGLWFRQTSNNADAIIFLIGLKFPKFRVGYSFDATISNSRSATYGSHEMSISFEISRKKQQKKTFKFLNCPTL
ncbi:MAG: PorP/SprF family type IX secretion system membrane protein [Bacteroidota bacterium]|jgi:type IX secretion system PorP/SprF family membrane protein|nr:PorP/SprF family type IX secretion system membrane protein [Sphingobacteriales bacterium]